jgi:NAD(P)-dependent dehydrogenase (short-subunit alcohol dehydrogenase family)
MRGRLEGQTAWITGAASGIGAATARMLAGEGANVVLIDLNGRAGEIAQMLAASKHASALFIRCDVSVEDQVRESLVQTAAHFGGLQIVINCAGIVHVKPLHEYDEAEWDRLMAVNLKSIFFSVKHGLQYLRQNARSYVVNVASISSFVGQGATPAYTASKSAVLGLTRSIALDYAALGLRCNCVCPGITDTPMLREHLNKTPNPDEALRQRLRRVPLGGPLSPEDIARAVLYLSCEDSAGVTGTSLVIDGGYLAAAEWDARSTPFAEEAR